MKNTAQWRPTKFVRKNGKLRGSRDSRVLSPGSRFCADLQAEFYGKAIERYARGRLLDLGCGRVPLFDVYRARVDEVVCADWPSSFHGVNFIDVFADANAGIPFRNEVFDTIIATDVLEHIKYPDRMFGDMVRVLAPNGCIILGVPFFYGIHEEPFDYHRYTEFKLRALCEDCGCSVEDLKVVDGIGFIILNLLMKRFSSARVAGPVVRTVADALVPRSIARTERAAFKSRPYPLMYVGVFRKNS